MTTTELQRRGDWSGEDEFPPFDRTAKFSECRKYRYTLWRSWAVEDMLVGECSAETKAHQFVQFIGLNPSTADEVKDDPTIRRCIGYAKAWGYGALCMTNLFAFRATDPCVMKAHSLPIGIGNTETIVEVARQAALVICAWGVHGAFLTRSRDVAGVLRSHGIQLYHLGLTADGEPKHPLYLRKSIQPVLWT